MGTYSNFKLRIEEENDLKPGDVLSVLAEVSNNYSGWEYDSDTKTFTLEEVKWYCFDSHMCKISCIYPQYTFILVKDTEWITVPYDNIWEYQYLHGTKVSSKKIEYKPEVHRTINEINELNENDHSGMNGVVLHHITKCENKLVENSLKDMSLKPIFQEQWQRDVDQYGDEAYKHYLFSSFSNNTGIPARSNNAVLTANYICRLGMLIDY